MGDGPPCEQVRSPHVSVLLNPTAPLLRLLVEDVRADALRAGKAQAEAERLARRQATRIGDGQTFGTMIRNDAAAAQGRRRKV